MPPVEFLAERQEAGKTIAALLRKRFGLSWSQAKRLIENGHVRVAGFAVSDPGHRIRAKNRVWIREGVVQVPRGGEKEKKPPVSREAKPRRHARPNRSGHRSRNPSPPHPLTPSPALFRTPRTSSTPTTRSWW